ncbi:MAG TPA: flagellar type III secretion system protein FlhB [Steroidobacter sp.]|nr:flagellar type III secretion system protein FlhB [Steroidobacter sp.]
MAENSTEDRREKASAQKLRKVREKGQTVRSRDWATAVGVCACLQLMVWLTPGLLRSFADLFALAYATHPGEGALENAWSALFPATLLLFAKMTAPLFVVPLIVGAASLYPGGWVFSASPLAPKLERVNPLKYFPRLFKPRHVIETAAAVLKSIALILVLWRFARGSVDDFLNLSSLSLDEALQHGVRLTMNGVLTLSAVFIIFALIDLPAQKLAFLREQRMSKREVKEEHKTTEGRPEVRQRIRQLQTQIARRSVRKMVPQADVVIVNPEHYAVALKYDEQRAEAPFLLAKGVDEMALYIRRIALEHEVEVVTLPPLARAIYNTSQVHQQIPAALYQAVARVLTYVLQIQAFRKGQRRVAPRLPTDLSVPRHLSEIEP